MPTLGLLPLALALALAFTLALSFALALALPLPLLALLTLLSLLLALLPLTLLSSLLRALARSLLERLRRASQPARTVEGGFHAIGVLATTLAECARCLGEALPHFINATSDVALGRVHSLGRRIPVDQILGVPQLVTKSVVANRACGLSHLARRCPLGRARVASRAIQLLFE